LKDFSLHFQSCSLRCPPRAGPVREAPHRFFLWLFFHLTLNEDLADSSVIS
jgi:hypothetical protein